MSVSNLMKIDEERFVDISQTIITVLEELFKEPELPRAIREHLEDLEIIIKMKAAKLSPNNGLFV